MNVSMPPHNSELFGRYTIPCGRYFAAFPLAIVFGRDDAGHGGDGADGPEPAGEERATAMRLQTP